MPLVSSSMDSSCPVENTCLSIRRVMLVTRSTSTRKFPSLSQLRTHRSICSRVRGNQYNSRAAVDQLGGPEMPLVSFSADSSYPVESICLLIRRVMLVTRSTSMRKFFLASITDSSSFDLQSGSW